MTTPAPTQIHSVEVDQLTPSVVETLLSKLLAEVSQIRQTVVNYSTTYAVPNAKLFRQIVKDDLVEEVFHHSPKAKVVRPVNVKRASSAGEGRHGVQWSDAEVNELINELNRGLSWTEIATKHSRTENAVRMRIGQYFGWRIRQGDTVELLANSINKSFEDVDALIQQSNERRRTSHR